MKELEDRVSDSKLRALKSKLERLVLDYPNITGAAVSAGLYFFGDWAWFLVNNYYNPWAVYHPAAPASIMDLAGPILNSALLYARIRQRIKPLNLPVHHQGLYKAYKALDKYQPLFVALLFVPPIALNLPYILSSIARGNYSILAASLPILSYGLLTYSNLVWLIKDITHRLALTKLPEKSFWEFTESIKNRFKKDKVKIKSFIKELESSKDVNVYYRQLAVSYLQIDNFDKAMEYLNKHLKQFKAGELLEYTYNFPASFRDYPFLGPMTYIFAHIGLLFSESKVSTAWLLSDLYMAHYGFKPKVQQFFWKAIGLFGRRDLAFNLAHSLFLETIDAEESVRQRQWGKVIALILGNPKFKQESIGETANLVYTFGPHRYLQTTFVFKENPELEVLQKEYELRNTLESLIKGLKQFRLPEVVVAPRSFTINNEQRNVYVMKRAPGITLMELIETAHVRDVMPFLYEVASFLGRLHASIPKTVSQRGKLHLALKVKSRLLYRELVEEIQAKAPYVKYRNLVRVVIQNYRPVYETLKQAQWCFNLDSHPEQYIISKDGVITRVDTEDKSIVPQQFDLVNLIEYNPKLSYEDKQQIISAYIASFNSLAHETGLAKIKNKEAFMLAYHNAVIQRAISLCGAWSSTTRHSMKRHRKGMLKAALRAVRDIRKYHSDFYEQHNESYQNLEASLQKISELIAVSR